MTETEVLLTETFWQMLIESNILPKELGEVTTFVIIGYPGKPLKVTFEKMIYEVETREFVRFLSEYEMTRKKDETIRRKIDEL